MLARSPTSAPGEAVDAVMSAAGQIDHWDNVYRTKQPGQVSWFVPHLAVSLSLLRQAGLGPGSRVIDIGGGASTLVDDLLDFGIADMTVVDISAAALDVARQRLGERSGRVRWLVADAARLDLPPLGYDLWHDRAALHFLAEAAAAAYVVALSATLIPGGHAVIGCFAKDGPERCSGLPVIRRDAADVAALFGSGFELLAAERDLHVTPWGSQQAFAYCLLRKLGHGKVPNPL